MCVRTHDGSLSESADAEVIEESGCHREKVLCQHCDLLLDLPRLKPGERATCPRCDAVLFRRWANPSLLPVSYAACALVMLFLSMLYPFIDINVAGNYSQFNLREVPQALMADDYFSLALLFVIFVQLIPLFSLSAIIVLCLDLPVPQYLRVFLARLIFILKPWCMVEIFLVGVLVSFVKLIAYGDIGIGLSFIPYCVFCLLQIKAFHSVDQRWLWRKIARPPKINKIMQVGQTGARQGLRLCQSCTAILPEETRECPRCHAKGRLRRRDSVQWTLALLFTSVMLYIPANLLPIMITVAIGDSMSSTILSGVITLWNDGSYPVAIIIFIASILIPCLKIVAIAWLCLYAKRYGRRRSEEMHRMYEIVEFVGRWSMIDIFVIAVLSTLLRMGNFMAVYPDIGALFFALVVILTMISAAMYDPRLIWDREPVPVSIMKEKRSAEKRI